MCLRKRERADLDTPLEAVVGVYEVDYPPRRIIHVEDGRVRVQTRSVQLIAVL